MLKDEVSAGCTLLAQDLNAEPDVSPRLLKLNLKLLVSLWSMNSLVEFLNLAEGGERIIKYSARAWTSAPARRCSPRSLRSHPDFRLRLSPVSSQYLRHTSVTRGGE